MTDQPHTNNREKTSTSTEEANIKLQEAFYGEKEVNNLPPTYINNNTPAIKITGDED